MVTKKTAKKTTKKTYKAPSSKTKSTKTGPKRGRKAGKKPNVPPPEDPIIVGGGSVPIVFGANFKEKLRGRKNQFDYDDPSAVVTEVVLLRKVGTRFVVSRRINLTPGEVAVGICYTNSTCF